MGHKRSPLQKVSQKFCGQPKSQLPRYQYSDWSKASLRAQSNAKIRFRSFFMLIMVQAFFFASSNSAGVKVPTLVTGKPCAVELYRAVHVKTLRSQKLWVLRTHRKLLRSKAIATENNLRARWAVW